MDSRRIKHIGRGTAVAAAVVLLGGGAVAVAASAGNGAKHGSTVLEDSSGKEVGYARFTEDATGAVHVNVHVQGMSAGLHGIHVHSVGSCGNGFADAGSHHNPGARRTATTPATSPTWSSTGPVKVTSTPRSRASRSTTMPPSSTATAAP